MVLAGTLACECSFQSQPYMGHYTDAAKVQVEEETESQQLLVS
jgi:hypothetical protein